MENFKGTKEDWRFSKEHLEITTSKPGILEGSKRVCTISYFRKESEEVQANGNLIAAAPLMYQYLFKRYNELDSMELNINSDMFKEYQEIKELLKKATE